DVERLPSVHDRIFDRVAHGTGDTAKYHVDSVLRDQLAHLGHRQRFIGRGVFDYDLQRSAQQSSARVDFVHDHSGDVGIGDAGDADRTGQVGSNANFD